MRDSPEILYRLCKERMAIVLPVRFSVIHKLYAVWLCSANRDVSGTDVYRRHTV
jgi:hypothetical protein